MFDTRSWLIPIALLALTGCPEPEERPTDEDDPCYGVTCLGHGTCVSPEGVPVCICHRGSERRELRCVASGADGDADADSDGDAVGCSEGCDLGDRCDPPSGECVPGAWVAIPAGTFDMGSPEDEVGRDPNEVLHSVTLTRDFEIWSTEVTIADFSRLMGYNQGVPSPCTTDCPVDRVTWHEAAAYCNALSIIDIMRNQIYDFTI